MDSINFARLQQIGNALTPPAGEASLEQIQEQRRQDEAAEEARQAQNREWLKEHGWMAARALTFEDAHHGQWLVHFSDLDNSIRWERKELARKLDEGADPDLLLKELQERLERARQNLASGEWRRYVEMQEKVNGF